MSLKQKTINAMLWSFVDKFSLQGVNFITGIILARLLSPREFGLIGLLTIFIVLSQNFIDSGFGSALIRKSDCTVNDYNTVFYFNLVIAFVLYGILYFSSGYISDFFKEPQLEILVKVLSLNLIISSAFFIQNVVLTKEINFKLKTKISIFSTVVSGVIAVTMALNGYGVWSLVANTLSISALSCLLFWIFNGWRPSWIFSIKSFRELFGFGSKLLISGIISTVCENINKIVIGKFYSASDLGFYNNADQLKNIPSSNLTGIVQRVSYPVFAELQNDAVKLKHAYCRIIGNTMFISFCSMFTLSAISRSFILTVLGYKWEKSADLLFLLCFVGVLYPIHVLNLNVLNLKGRSDLYLKLEIIKKIIGIPAIFVGVYFGVKALIYATIATSIASYFLNSYYTNSLISLSAFKQLKLITPSFIISSINGIVVWFLGSYLELYLHCSQKIILTFQLVVSIFNILILSELLKNKDYLEIKSIIINLLKKI